MCSDYPNTVASHYKWFTFHLRLVLIGFKETESKPKGLICWAQTKLIKENKSTKEHNYTFANWSQSIDSRPRYLAAVGLIHTPAVRFSTGRVTIALNLFIEPRWLALGYKYISRAGTFRFHLILLTLRKLLWLYRGSYRHWMLVHLWWTAFHIRAFSESHIVMATSIRAQITARYICGVCVS